MIRRKIAAANWKMNLTLASGIDLASQIAAGLKDSSACEVIIAPPLPYLAILAQQLKGTTIAIAAQNCHYAASGAFTGEVSVDIIRSAGATYCITGHSERRQMFAEDNEVIRKKVDAILNGGLTPVFCCGESLELREADQQEDFVLEQLEQSLFHLDGEVISRVIIAYEPIWAIGTGRTASPQQAQEMHQFIREAIATKYHTDMAERMPILYGGSMKADNAVSLFDQPDVDGGLIGGASLKAEEFLAIVAAASRP